MLTKMIEWSLAHRVIVLLLAALVMAAGVWTALRLPVEVLPDLTKPTVVVLTEAPGLAPEEVELRVTQPLEAALMGVGGLTRLRAHSDVSLSLVYAEFDWGVDIHKARLQVQERLQVARDRLPEGVQPFMTPVASLMGEILLVGVRCTLAPGEDGYLSPPEVRSLADWTIMRRLQSVKGVAEVLNMGGGVRQMLVEPDPYKMLAHGVSLEELREVAGEAALNTTGGFLTAGPTEVMVRNLAMTVEPDDIARTVIKKINDRPVVIGDVAEVSWGLEPMRGDATVSKSPEKVPTYGVIMSITKSPGEDTRRLTKDINDALGDLQASLPKGVETLLLFQQKDFIDHAMGNLTEAIRDGAIMVSLVLILFLMNIRTAFIILMAIPLSFAVTFLVFRWFDISVNSMTLGGLAVAIGMVVDDAIVDVENVFRRLREWGGRRKSPPGDDAPADATDSPLMVIARASGEVRNSIFYATVLIILVFLPLLGLSGVEGRLFAPTAVATILSMIASFLVSLTVIPVLCYYLLRPGAGFQHREGALARGAQWLLEHTALRFGLNQPALLMAAVGMLVLFSFSLYPSMSKDFLPRFQEETALVAATSAPGTSLQEMNRISDAIETQILTVPEVRQIGRRLGRAERGDHVVPVSTAEFDVDFKEEVEGSLARPRKEVIEEISRKIRGIPGVFAVVGGPLADRIGHMMSGVSAPVVVKVFGPDLDKLREIGTQIRDLAVGIPGLEDAKLDQTSLIPQLRIEPDRDRSTAYGVAPGHLNKQLATLIGGETVAELRDGVRTIDLVLRLPASWRELPEQISQLPVETEDGKHVPLELVAEVREAKGPNLIVRENSLRRFAVAIKPRSEDVGQLVSDLQEQVREKIALPEGYFVTYEGEFQAQEEASRRILWLTLAVFVFIAFLLGTYFGSPVFAFQVLCDIPLALIGGLLYTHMKSNNISIATLVGFIAVAGVAARNSIMLISHYLRLMRTGGWDFGKAMIIHGTRERLVPVLMTALTAGIGLIPLVMAADQPGKEILHPVAVVICGGLVTSTLLCLVVTPSMFHAFGRKAALKAVAARSPATQ